MNNIIPLRTRPLPIFVILLLLLFSFSFAQNNSLPLIPIPVEVQQMTGSFSVTAGASITYNRAESRSAAEMFANKIRVPTGFSIAPKQGTDGSIQFGLLDKRNQQIGAEGYVLEVTPRGISVSANSAGGLFYGMQTLLQLMPKEIEGGVVANIDWTIPAVRITDYPRFGWRGIMLDVSRNFFPKEDVKSYIEQIARYKYNVFHWHLSDDHGWRIEIKSLPKLTKVGAWRVERAGAFGSRTDPIPGEKATVGGFYTQDDIKEIIQFARQRNVTIVPEIDLPGHSMAAIASYPELSCKKDTGTMVNPGTHFAEWYGNGTFKMNIENTLNPSDENVYSFLEKVFGEIAELFPGPYIHVGGDECYKGYWAQDTGCIALMRRLNIRHVEDLQGYFMNRMEKILKAKGKKLLGWDEIIEGGISPDATIMSWRGVKGGIEAARTGHDVVMTPTTFSYLDYNQGDQTVDPPIYAGLRVKKSYSFEPVPDGVDAKYILGGQGNLWTEQIPNLRAAEYMSYPRAWALAEVYWSPKEKKDWRNFSRRMELHFTRAEAADINYSRASFDAIIKTSIKNGALIVAMDKELSDLDIYYTIDDTMPDDHSLRYTNAVELPGGPVTLRVITYRNGKPIGHLITLKQDELQKRAGK